MGKGHPLAGENSGQPCIPLGVRIEQEVESREVRVLYSYILIS